MKKTAFLLLALSLVTPGLSAQAANYSNGTAGFSLVYPDGWSKSESVKGAALAVVGPRTNGFSRNVNVVIQDVPTGITLAQIAEASQTGLAKAITGFKLTSQRAVKVGSENGRELIYTGTLPSQTPAALRWRQRYALHGGKLFVITQTSLASDSGADKAMNTALDSFKFLK